MFEQLNASEARAIAKMEKIPQDEVDAFMNKTVWSTIRSSAKMASFECVLSVGRHMRYELQAGKYYDRLSKEVAERLIRRGFECESRTVVEHYRSGKTHDRDDIFLQLTIRW